MRLEVGSGLTRLTVLGALLLIQLTTSTALQAQASAVPAAQPAPVAATPAPSGAPEFTPPTAAATPAVQPPTAADGGNTEGETDTQPARDRDWDLAHRRYASWVGPTGGLFLLDGRAGEPGAVRVQLGLDAFAGSNYLQEGDKIEVAGQTLAFSGTVHPNVEVFATLANRSTTQTRGGARTLDALGDIGLGAKFGTQLSKVVDIGGDLRGLFANKAGRGGFEWGATSLWLRSALGLDLQGLDKPFPFIARFNAGYLFDNTAQLVSDTENERYDQLSAPDPKVDETRHLVGRFERLGTGVNRLDRFTFGAGVEFPLRLAKHFYLHPLAEWQLGLPANRQGYDCPYVVGTPNIGNTRSSVDSCYERNPSVVPMNLSIGLRIVPPVRGLSALFGVDVGLTGTRKFVQELVPNQPWRVLFALSYDYDARPPAPAPIVAPPPVVAVPVVAPTGRVEGVASAVDGTPVQDARIAFLDRTLTALATDAEGRFTTEPLPPGPVSMQASHPDYEPGACAAVIAPTGGNVPVRCTLTAKPLIGTVHGQLTDTSGSPVANARVQFIGPSSELLSSDAQGAFAADNLSPGTYLIRIESGSHYTRQVSAVVEARSTTLVNATLMRKPITPNIQVKDDTIVAPNLKFIGESSDLDPVSATTLAEIADLLLTRSDLYLQVQGYGTESMALARAVIIKRRLVEAGVPEIRIEAVGGGKRGLRLVLHH